MGGTGRALKGVKKTCFDGRRLQLVAIVLHSTYRRSALLHLCWPGIPHHSGSLRSVLPFSSILEGLCVIYNTMLLDLVVFCSLLDPSVEAVNLRVELGGFASTDFCIVDNIGQFDRALYRRCRCGKTVCPARDSENTPIVALFCAH